MKRGHLAAGAVVTMLCGAACAEDVSGGDCVVDGLVRMGLEDVPSATFECTVPAGSWIVAFPASVDAGTLPLPGVFRPVVAESAQHGRNWCVGQAAPDGETGSIVCRTLPVRVERATAIRATRIVVELRRLPGGEAALQRLSAHGD